MTDTKDEPTEGTELDRLRAKNRELLAENRQLKDRNRELTDATSAQAVRLRRYEVDGPIGQLIEEIAMPGTAEAFRVLLEQHVRFEAADDGQLRILDTVGKPLTLPAIPGTKGREVEREAQATVEDLRAIVTLPELSNRFAAITIGSRASGGGAGGVHTSPAAPAQTRKPPEEPRQEPRLGLR